MWLVQTTTRGVYFPSCINYGTSCAFKNVIHGKCAADLENLDGWEFVDGIAVFGD